MTAPSRILIARTDRLGDVLLSLPTLLWAKESLPSSTRVDFLCRKNLLSILGPFLSEKEIRPLAWEDHPEPFAAGKYDGVCFLYAEPKLLWKAFVARVPVRSGLRSRVPSFLTLNWGIRQKRSRAEKNEGQYAQDLMRHFLTAFGVENKCSLPTISLPICEEGKELATKKLQELGVFPQTPFVVLHPGMGGSALNLSAKQYSDLAKAVRQAVQLPVLISKGPLAQDQKLVDAMQAEGLTPPILEGLPLNALMEVFRQAKWVIAPSTGPLHLAHAVGTPVVGLFPPVRTQRAERWGPWGGVGEISTFMPEVNCQGTKNCLGKSCPVFFCMESFPWTKLVTDCLVNARN